MFEKSFKILNFGSNGMHPKFTVLVHFGAQFTTPKPKNLLKTKIYTKTASLGIPNNVSPRSQRNHRILVELSKKKKKNWGEGEGGKGRGEAQIGSKLPPGAASKVYQKFSHIL